MDSMEKNKAYGGGVLEGEHGYPAEGLALSADLEEGVGERELWGPWGRGLPAGKATAAETPTREFTRRV